MNAKDDTSVFDDTAVSTTRGQKIIIGLALMVSLLWPFGPLVVAALVALTLYRHDRRQRRTMVMIGLVLSVAYLVLVSALFISGLAGHLMFSTTS